MIKRRPLRDTTANNAFTRFDAAFTKKYKDQLEDFNEDEYRKLESLKDLFEFLDDIIPDDDEDEPEPKKKITRKRYSVFATSGDESRRLIPSLV